MKLFGFGPTKCCGWPDLRERMVYAVVRNRIADIASIQHEAVIRVFPVFLRNKLLEVFRDLGEIGVAG